MMNKAIFCTVFAGLMLGAGGAFAQQSGQLQGLGGHCLEVQGGRADAYAPVGIGICNGAPNQQWQLQPDGTVRGLGGMCLDVKHVNDNDGTALVMYPCHAGANQRWSLQAQGRLVGLGNKCMDVDGGNNRPGTRVILFGCHGHANQTWHFTPLAAPVALPPPVRQAGNGKRIVEAGPLWNQQDATNKCPQLCAPTVWTGQWWTTRQGQMSVCECDNVRSTPLPPPLPPQAYDAEAGPLWNQGEANQRCPAVCAPGTWNGQWRTVVAGKRSVCGCVPPQGPGVEVRERRDHERDRERQPLEKYNPRKEGRDHDRERGPAVTAMDSNAFAAFAQRVRDASFPASQVAAVDDQVRAGSRFTCRQLIEIMTIVSFPDTQVKTATAMWQNVVDPVNAPEVINSLTFESHRQQLRKNIGL